MKYVIAILMLVLGMIPVVADDVLDRIMRDGYSHLGKSMDHGGLAVHIDGIDDDPPLKDSLEEAADQRFRAAGIHVSEVFALDGLWCQLNLFPLDGSDSFTVYSVSCDLRTCVSCSEHEIGHCDVKIDGASGIGMTRTSELRSALMETLNGMTDKFAVVILKYRPDLRKN